MDSIPTQRCLSGVLWGIKAALGTAMPAEADITQSQITQENAVSLWDPRGVHVETFRKGFNFFAERV